MVRGMDFGQNQSNQMTITPLFHDSVESNLTQASRYLARAATELRERGDYNYATLIDFHLHSLHRPEYLKAAPQEPVLPSIPARVRH